MGGLQHLDLGPDTAREVELLGFDTYLKKEHDYINEMKSTNDKKRRKEHY